jgi:hypothetical protein
LHNEADWTVERPSAVFVFADWRIERDVCREVATDRQADRWNENPKMDACGLDYSAARRVVRRTPNRVVSATI